MRPSSRETQRIFAMHPIVSRLGLAAALSLSLSFPLSAQAPSEPARAGAQRGEQQGQRPDAARLPPDSVTPHVLDLPGRSLKFTATAGSLTLVDPQGAPQADIGYVAYTLDGGRESRPVTFAV